MFYMWIYVFCSIWCSILCVVPSELNRTCHRRLLKRLLFCSQPSFCSSNFKDFKQLCNDTMRHPSWIFCPYLAFRIEYWNSNRCAKFPSWMHHMRNLFRSKLLLRQMIHFTAKTICLCWFPSSQIACHFMYRNKIYAPEMIVSSACHPVS